MSRTTVSFVLNNVAGMQISGETRERVLEAPGLGYFQMLRQPFQRVPRPSV